MQILPYIGPVPATGGYSGGSLGTPYNLLVGLDAYISPYWEGLHSFFNFDAFYTPVDHWTIGGLYYFYSPYLGSNKGMIFKVLVTDTSLNYDPTRVYYAKTLSFNDGNYDTAADAISGSSRIAAINSTIAWPIKTLRPMRFKFLATPQVFFRPLPVSGLGIIAGTGPYAAINVSMPDAYISTPDGNKPIGDASETLTADPSTRSYLGAIRNYYNVPGRLNMQSNWEGSISFKVYYGSTYHSTISFYPIGDGTLPATLDFAYELNRVTAGLFPGYTLSPLKIVLNYSLVASCKKPNQNMRFTITSENGWATSTPYP